MSLTHRYPKWRSAESLVVFRALGGPARSEYRTPVFLVAGVDFTDTEFTLDAFDAQTEGWALDVTCPCGEQVTGESAGDLLRNIYRHCAAAKHPRPRFEP